MVNKTSANVENWRLTETAEAQEGHFAVTRSHLLSTEIKSTQEKFRMYIDFYTDNNMVWKTVAAYLPSGKWEAFAIKSYHIPTCMENLNQQQSQKQTFCQRMNIHSVASTTQVELNINANNCYNFILIFSPTATSKIKIEHNVR